MLYLATEMPGMFPNKAKEKEKSEDLFIPITIWHQK